MADRIVSLAALTVLEVGPFETIRIARACGYSHVGLRPVAATPEEPHIPVLENAANRSELGRVLDGEGIAVLDCEIVRLVPAIDWDAMARVVEFAAQFGAARLLVADNDRDAVRSAESLDRLAQLAAPAGITPCLEFMPWTEAPDLAAARQRIARIANAALLIDAFHLARSGGQPGEIQPGDRISYLQLCDIAGPIPAMDEILREARSDRLFPGEGTADLRGLLARCPEQPISLEVPADRLRDNGVPAIERARLAIAAARRVMGGEPADA